MSKKRFREAGSPELQLALEALRRSGYAVGSPMRDRNGRTSVVVGGKLFWEEEVLQMSKDWFIPGSKAPDPGDKEN